MVDPITSPFSPIKLRHVHPASGTEWRERQSDGDDRPFAEMSEIEQARYWAMRALERDRFPVTGEFDPAGAGEPDYR